MRTIGLVEKKPTGKQTAEKPSTEKTVSPEDKAQASPKEAPKE